jgi:hypothetical protein
LQCVQIGRRSGGGNHEHSMPQLITRAVNNVIYLASFR